MSGFVDCLLLRFVDRKEFRKPTRVKYNTFIYLSKRLDLYLKREDTCFRVIVSVQKIVAMLLRRLGSDNGLQGI